MHTAEPLPGTIDWQAAVKGWFLKKVPAPFSAQHVFNGPPQQGYAHTTFEGTIFAYSTVVRVNAKDSSGAYIGFLRYLFIFKNNHIIKVALLAELEAFLAQARLFRKPRGSLQGCSLLLTTLGKRMIRASGRPEFIRDLVAVEQCLQGSKGT